eukprot:707625-Alexandrium_andersonii.AAC.1
MGGSASERAAIVAVSAGLAAATPATPTSEAGALPDGAWAAGPLSSSNSESADPGALADGVRTTGGAAPSGGVMK